MSFLAFRRMECLECEDQVALKFHYRLVRGLAAYERELRARVQRRLKLVPQPNVVHFAVKSPAEFAHRP
eukprot:2180930-Pyramimonas_sp.AAC.1